MIKHSCFYFVTHISLYEHEWILVKELTYSPALWSHTVQCGRSDLQVRRQESSRLQPLLYKQRLYFHVRCGGEHTTSLEPWNPTQMETMKISHNHKTLKKVLKSQLDGKKQVHTINMCVVSIIRYPTVIIV